MTTDRSQAEAALRDASAVTGRRWHLAARLDGGRQTGAWLVRAEDGTAAVLKTTADAQWAARVVAARRAVEVARRAGYPTPAWLAAGTTRAGIGYQVQEWCPGHTSDDVDTATAEALIAVVESQAGVDPSPEHCWTDFLREQIGTGRERLRAESGAPRPMLDVCDRLVRDADRATWPRSDMVHGDFRPANVLFDGGSVSGVVDVEAIGSGPRAFDLATLLSHDRVDQDALVRIVAAGTDAAEPVVFRACVAVVFLDLLRFSRRDEHSTADGRARQRRLLTERAEWIELLTR